MRKPWALALFLAMFWLAFQAVPLSAQEWDDDGDFDFHRVDLYSRGDQTFTISLGVIFPTAFVFRDGLHRPYGHGWMPVGGTGSLAYTHFLGPNFFLGGEIGVKFNGTVGGNTIFIIPIGIRAGWQFLFRRFEFPVGLTFGIAPQRRLEDSYIGIFLRGWGAAYFRFSPDWSFGINTDWTWIPQRPNPRVHQGIDRAVDANMVGLTISARYHF